MIYSMSDCMTNAAKAFMGAKTGSGRHSTIVAIYNSIRPLPRNYTLKNNDAWCAAFISACGKLESIVPAIIKPECGAHEMYLAYPESQRLADRGRADRGDLVFYDWNQDGRVDHVGIIDYAFDGQLAVVEGNCENSVRYRFIFATDPAIKAIIRPDYGDDEHVMFVTCDVLNLRKEPSMDSEIISELSYGEYVTVRDEVEGWAAVEVGTLEGFCGSAYLANSAPPASGQTITAVNLRSGAGTDSKIIRVLPAMTEFHYTGDRQAVGGSTWERVYVPSMDVTGWLNIKYARPIE